MATSLTAPNPLELIRSSHVAPIANLVNGTDDGNNIPVAFIQQSSTSSYTLRARNKNTDAGAPVFKASANTGGSEVTLLDVTRRGTIIKRAFDQGGFILNVKAFAATNVDTVGINASTDADTVAIEATIAAMKALSVAQFTLSVNTDGRMLHIHFPAGRYNLIRPVDLDGCVGLRVTGDGMEATTFGIAITGLSIPSYWANKSMFSMVGSNFCRLEAFSLTPTNNASSACPEAGLLISSNSAYTNWLGSSEQGNVANRIEVYSIRVRGAFTKAAHVAFANVSSVYVSCDFSRDEAANATYASAVGGSINQACLVLTRDNQVEVTQCGSVSFIVPTSVSTSCSDITFIDLELHDDTNGGSGTCICPALWLDEAYDIKFLGGNWSSHAQGNTSCGYVRMSPGLNTANEELLGCRNIIIDGIYFSNEGGGGNCTVGLRVTGNVADNATIPSTRIQNEGGAGSTLAIAASDITIRNCRVALADGGGILNGGRSDNAGGVVAYFIRWRLENVCSYQDVSTIRINEADVMLFGGTDTADFTDCYIECHGMSLTGNGSTFTRGTLVRPGGITGLTITHGDYQIDGGGAASLAASGTVYYGMGSANATEASVVPVTFTQACKAINLHVRVSAAPDNGGGTQTLTYTLRKATPATGFTFADTALTGTITETSVIGADTTGAHAVSFAKGDVALLKIVAGAGTTTNAWATWALSCIPESA